MSSLSFSLFNGNKMITTGGGMILTNDKEYAGKCEFDGTL